MKPFLLKIIFPCLFASLCYAFTERPSLFVIGDSISIFYGPQLKKELAPFFHYDRKRDQGEAIQNLDTPVGANGGDSRMVIEYLNTLKNNPDFKADILLLNCGLHDIKRDVRTGEIAVPLNEYKANLEKIYHLAQSLNLQLIWVSSTPVDEKIHNTKSLPFNRYNKDVLAYNKTATRFFSKKNIPIIDLYEFSAKFGTEGYMDHVHYKPEYAARQARFIADYIKHNFKLIKNN